MITFLVPLPLIPSRSGGEFFGFVFFKVIFPNPPLSPEGEGYLPAGRQGVRGKLICHEALEHHE